MRLNKLHFVVSCLMAVALCAPAVTRAQEPGGETVGRGGPRAGMQRAIGEVTAVNGANLTVKGQDGATFTVVTTDNTRIMKGRGNMIKIADIKVGDGLMAMGNLDAPNKTMHAMLVMTQDAAEVKKERENMGKTFIYGKVTAIDVDNAKMTVARADGTSQTIGFDESTSFRRGRTSRGGDTAEAAAPTPGAESLTLADIKVGDNVGGPGSVKNGVFVPSTLSVSTPGQARQHNPDTASQAPASR